MIKVEIEGKDPVLWAIGKEKTGRKRNCEKKGESKQTVKTIMGNM